MMSNSCVETPDAPEWLSKLEDRRQKSQRCTLAHESGAGAPCIDCGDACPGLDLHFWRKVCRNCKCRKDQHMCTNEDTSGWAQFEILGQIRSKPAYINIKTLATQPVQVEWVPPNVSKDIAVDYMENLGSDNVPIAGSKAAAKRKQQLEFQVPPHDIDATLCDNLSQAEVNQLQQYVQKIREHCVGQGNVTRANLLPNVYQLNASSTAKADSLKEIKCLETLLKLNETPVKDAILCDLLSNNKLVEAILHPVEYSYNKNFIVFTKPLEEDNSYSENLGKQFKYLSKSKLYGLNEQCIQSIVTNGVIYDKIFAILKNHNLDISRDPCLGPISALRQEYLSNPLVKTELEAINSTITLTKQEPAICSKAALVYGLKSSHAESIIYDCGLPTNVDYDRDNIFAKIIGCEDLQRAVHSSKSPGGQLKPIPLTLSVVPMFSSIQEYHFSAETKRKLSKLGVCSHEVLQSAVLNSPFYQRLFQMLDDRNITFEQCKLLQPLKQLTQALCSDPEFYHEVRDYVTTLPNSFEMAYAPVNLILPTTVNRQSNEHEVLTLQNSAATIPESKIMQSASDDLVNNLENLSLTTNDSQFLGIKCHDCSLNIGLGEVVVKAARAGRHMAWHPACFKCRDCRELLADLVYFFHGGQIYCGRDLAQKLKIPRCKACDELIFTKEYTAAEGDTFHIKHFCCFHCDTPLAGQQYVPDEKTNLPLCLKCYNQYYAACCQRCQQIIGPTDQGVSWMQLHWHQSCFVCAGLNCNHSLIGGRFCIKQNMPFCSSSCVRSILD